ncbi:YdcF family protein [candidate division Kazan bacterium]|uniref:YdcF family protein n=1 Tax=candidate division Kazan bacterium TaxID=2202143 RepID=A0A420ZE29_UNCK3|nr:MAG: YdcF family protein [candidate division Kazan bacterium]
MGVGFYLSPQDKLERSDAIVVISGGETEARVKEGVQLFQDEWAPLVIVSGAARDEGISNAAMMKQIAISLGIPASSIIIEENAQTTWENANYVADIMESNKINSIILVTSPYHQRRAYLNFRYFLGNDFKIINHSAKDSAWRKNGWWNLSWTRHLTFAELQKIIYSNWLLTTQDV